MKVTRKEFLKMIAAAGAGWPAMLALGSDSPKGPSKFTLSTKRLKLRHTWSISRNSSDFKDNVFVFIERDGVVGMGEAAPNVRYGESVRTDLGNSAECHGALWIRQLVSLCRYAEGMGRCNQGSALCWHITRMCQATLSLKW